MSLINSIGYGMVKAAETAQPFLLNMQQADIQKLRDERLAELQDARDKNLLKLQADAKKATGAELAAEQEKLLKPREDQIDRNLEEAGGNAAARDFVKNESGITDKERSQAGAQAASKLGLIEQQRLYEDQVRHIDLKEHQERSDKNQEKHYQNEEKRLGRAAELTDIQIKAAKLAYDRAQQENKISPADKLRFDSLNKAYESTTKSINDARAKNEFDPNSENGKSLLAEQANYATAMAEIMAPYGKQTSATLRQAALKEGQEIPQRYIDALKANPDKRADFDSKFGSGASDIYLKQAKVAPEKPTAKKTTEEQFNSLSSGAKKAIQKQYENAGGWAGTGKNLYDWWAQ